MDSGRLGSPDVVGMRKAFQVEGTACAEAWKQGSKLPLNYVCLFSLFLSGSGSRGQRSLSEEGGLLNEVLMAEVKKHSRQREPLVQSPWGMSMLYKNWK